MYRGWVVVEDHHVHQYGDTAGEDAIRHSHNDLSSSLEFFRVSDIRVAETAQHILENTRVKQKYINLCHLY